jgi:AhpD family alkylhydroperoxidase
MSKVKQWVDERDSYNKVLAKYADTNMKKFYGLDNTTYEKGALDKKTKELLGLISSFVLRCDDCILYHLIQSHKAGVTSEELTETLMIGMLVGGSITIPHLRRAMKVWDEELGGTSNPVTGKISMVGV